MYKVQLGVPPLRPSLTLRNRYPASFTRLGIFRLLVTLLQVLDEVQVTVAVTLAVEDMARAMDFYRTKVGLELLYGGETASFSSLRVGDGYLNLILSPTVGHTWWGRLIFHVDDVDALHRRLLTAGLTPVTAPEDASWGERYFHINDPDGHELSFACRLPAKK